MPDYAFTLEFSEDPLSDTTPTWTDVTDDLLEVEWFSGKTRDLDTPQAGGAVFRLKNTARRFEPDYTAGEFYPNIDLLRRFRLTVTPEGGADVEQGVYYATDWPVEYPAGLVYSEVVVTCSDGHEVLSLDTVPLLDPPDATTYRDVVLHDAPSAFWPLDDPGGAGDWTFKDVVGELHLTPNGGLGGKRRQDAPDALRADGEFSLRLDGTDDYLSRAFTANLNPAASEAFSIEYWAYPTAAPSADNDHKPVVSSTEGAAGVEEGWWTGLYRNGGVNYWSLAVGNGAGSVAVQDSDSVPATLNDWNHVVVVWDNGATFVYVNGELGNPTGLTFGTSVYNPNDAGVFRIGRHSIDSGVYEHFQGYVTMPAFYDYALPAARVAAHFQAGTTFTNGGTAFAEQTAGERVAEAATHALWAETGIETGTHVMQATRHVGQSKLDVIRDAAGAEPPHSLFFFDRVGDPTYLGWNHLDGAAVAATFGEASGEIDYQDIDLEYDNEIFNEVTVSRPGGVAQTATDTTSSGARGRRATALQLNHADDADCHTVAQAIIDHFSTPQQRPATLTLNADDPDQLDEILGREIGDLVRVKRLTATPIDRVAHIVGWHKTAVGGGANSGPREFTCTFNLSRGFNAAAGVWRLGVDGFSELGETTVLA